MQNSCRNSQPIDSWHREFPRIAELRDRLQTTEGTFFHVIPSIIQKSSLAREVYQEHESDLAALDDIAWFAFRTKALKRDLKSHGSRGYTDIHSVLCEARGYRYLIEELKSLELKHDRIVLIPEGGKSKSPEWAAYHHESLVALNEVKTIYQSDNCLNRICRNTESILNNRESAAWRVAPDITARFWTKLQLTVDAAKDQLNAYEPNKAVPRIALLIVHFDPELRLMEGNRKMVASFLDGLSEGLFKVAYQFQG